ncbi:MAG TPA: tetratricopeptide repeat protein [Clostridia bacterium]|nr:tetratricopeptide repeat protein [Clostridia bacterium]
MQGNPEAEHNYGFAFANGIGVAKDTAAAIMWFTKAAEHGNPGSAFDLAQMLLTDERGDPAIEALGVAWLRKSADMGHPAAQFNMGRAYSGALYFETDLIEAYKWYLLASNAEPERTREPLKALELSLSPEDLAQARSRAADWCLRHGARIVNSPPPPLQRGP